MSVPIKKAAAADSLATIANILLCAFIIGALYLGREILVPLALAALLTFMLGPLATRLQRWLGRIGAVLSVVLMMVIATLGAGWVLTSQAVDLARQLPDYKVNIQQKLRAIHVPKGGPMKRISETWDELKKDLPGSGQAQGSSAGESRESPPTPVTVVERKDERLEFMQVILTPVLGPLGTAALVLLLLVFMLLQRDDLRSRLIRLVGEGRIGATTRAMDDAAVRVSKYLRMQLIVNVTYGIPVAVGLYFIGIPNAILWGALATVLRFIPYVGPWIAAAFPILISLAVSPDWIAPLLTIGLFVALELVSNNVMEPWLYGTSTGVSPIALIVAALFWTFLWGPVGLVLATPLTVCLVVMGRHVPKLAFLSIILSDEEALTPAEECYYQLQRAGGHGGMDLVETFLKSNPPADLFDSVLIPVIIAAGTDQRAGLLDRGQLEMIQQGMADILEELDVPADPSVSGTMDPQDSPVCCLPAKAQRDVLAGEMLAHLLSQQGFAAHTAPVSLPPDQQLDWIARLNPRVVCVSAVAPTTIIHARHLCSRLRRSFPDLTIIAGIWGGGKRATDASQALKDSGADEVVTTLMDAAARVEFHAAAAGLPFPSSLKASRILQLQQGGSPLAASQSGRPDSQPSV